MLQSLLLTGTFSLVLICMGARCDAQGASYTDQDWNTAFVDNCGLPNPKSVELIQIGEDQKLKFTLEQGDKGKCSADNFARHRALFWERAELAQKERMRLGHLYRISAEIQILSGFTVQREAFCVFRGDPATCTDSIRPPIPI